jgi:pimeloyl-ACP methyl ester carboxylesterase
MKPTIRHLSLIIILLTALGTCVSSLQAQTDLPDIDRPGFSPIECPIEMPAGYTIECGMVTVPEDHAQPDGPTIKLAVAVVHSISPHPAPDPVLFIDGGPGGRTLDNMSFWLEYVNPLLARRDVVFFVQRGIAYSEPALECPEIDPRMGILELLRSIEPFVACRDRLTGLGIDLSAYNSAQNAADIAVLRQALGYEEWNLYGVSYGSRVALTVLRDRPQGVRSAILDSVQPIDTNIMLDDAGSAKVTLQKLFAACQADFVCRTVYPNLEQVYADVVNDLAADPVALEIVNSKTGESKTEVLDGLAFNLMVVGSLDMPRTSGAPGLIYEVRAGNYESIIAYHESTWEESEELAELPAAAGHSMAMWCNDEAPFVTPEEIEEMLVAYPADVNAFAAIGELSYIACQAWGVGPADPVENVPVVSDVPALFLAGEYDAALPSTVARRTAETLSNSTVVEFPGAGHSVVLAGECPLDVMGSFLDDPSSAPDTSCLAKMDTPQFYVTVNPTRPVARIVAVLAGVAGLAILLYAVIRVGGLAERGQIPWRVVLRRVGWRSLVLNAVLSTALYLVAPAIDLTYFYERSLAQMIVIVGPLVIAIQTALLVAPDDEPGLETILACPRPFHWLFVERVAVVLAGQSLAALGVMAVGAWALGEGVLTAIGGWIASVLFMSGLAAFVSVRSRKATMGVLIALLAWLVLGAMSSNMGEGLLPAVPLDFPFPWPRPLGLIQPLVWMAHPFLRPDSLTLADFALNRVIVGALGLGLMALAMIMLTDTERLLLGTRAGKRTPKRQPTKIARVRHSEERSDEESRIGGDGKKILYFLRSLRMPRSKQLSRGVMADVKLAQLGAMVRYELLMSWRRGTLRAVLLSILVFPQMFYLINYVFGSADGPTTVNLTMWPAAVLLMGTDEAIMANITTLVMIILLLPLMLAELVPLDRQYRVREIVDTLPITRSIYLAGKLLSVWPTIAIGMALSALLSGVLTWTQNGPFHIGVLAAFWITGLIPLALFTAQMSVMLPAGQSSRRRAILMGLVASVVGLAACFILPVNGFLFAALIRDGLTLEQLADPLVRAAAPSFPDALSPNTLLRIGGTFVIMAAVWIATVRTMQREQN